ncbi:Protein CBG25956 [Caenorhabditis briggsae]|uniref:Protein CBG25956 n=1 Tax=Caenorhabditis briggsae TaxID=6238 RepID=B6IHD9_CAEBR|nr:Protein CBG25956 [Caenorhabditis briggsae]CAR99319.1 Protein CBG25956 [Caenorhabditis briggsae]
MAFLLILIIVPSLVQCISKKKEKNRKLDRSTPIVDSRSRVSKKRSVIDVAAVVPPAVPPLKSKDKTLKEQATQDTPPNEAGKAKNKKKKKKSKSKEKTVTKTRKLHKSEHGLKRGENRRQFVQLQKRMLLRDANNELSQRLLKRQLRKIKKHPHCQVLARRYSYLRGAFFSVAFFVAFSVAFSLLFLIAFFSIFFISKIRCLGSKFFDWVFKARERKSKIKVFCSVIDKFKHKNCKNFNLKNEEV